MSDKRFTWIHSGQLNAPQMDGVKLSEGQMLKVLDAVLATGFNPQTATAVTGNTSSVTITFPGEHGYELKQIVAITGASDENLNGRHRVLSRTRDTITIDAKGVTSFTGTVVAKVAPLGFESLFGDTVALKRAYRSTNPEGTRTVLYLDGTLPTGAGYNTANPTKRYMVDLCENMTVLGTQINSYTSVINNKAKNKNGSMFWYQARPNGKLDPCTATGFRSWVIVGNGDVFYLFNEWQDYGELGSKLRDLYVFGDIDSLGIDSDQYNCVWTGSMQPNDIDGIYQASLGASVGGDIDTYPTGFFIKEYTGIGTLQPFSFTTNGSVTEKTSGRSTETYVIPTPNPVSQSLICFPIHALTKTGLRGSFPGLMYLPQNLDNNRASYDLVFTGNVITIATALARNTTSTDNGFYAIDLGE